MKPSTHQTIYRQLALLGACLFLLPTIAGAANVCQEGLGIPPFLSTGAKPNLLLAIDNSGSMLDTAYVNTVGECVDNGFDGVNNTYAGLFDPDKWYQWTAGVPQWMNGSTYSVGDYVYTEGVFYKATAATGNASVGASIDADTSATWAAVYQIPKWTNGDTYLAHSFVRYQDQLYYSAAGGTANDPNSADGITIQGDTMAWVPVDSTWLSGHAYNSGDIVSDHGMLFRATSSGTSAGTGVTNDTGVTWTRLNEGYFVETAYTTSNDAQTGLSSAAGDGYKQDHLYAKVLSVGGVQSGVTAFAASGNLLNWASASKFDIQKKILTGGKYNDGQQSLTSEGRGCSSRGFIKEVPVTDSSGTANVITFSIRGFSDDDWIDTTDDTTRIAILGVSAEGFIGSDRQKACQTVIDEVAKGADANQGIIRTNVDTCLAYTGANNVLAESNAAYNHSIHTCWSIAKMGYTLPSQLGNVNEIINACENIYDGGVSPSTIDPYNSGYMCYGVYNNTIPDANLPTGSGSSRDGYVGRCWEPGNVPAGCTYVSCNAPYNTGNPRCMPDNKQYQCSGNYNSSKDTCNKAWNLVLVDADLTDGIDCNINGVATAGHWTDDSNPNPSLQCIQEAMWDYCGSLKIPEVIDPTDQIFNTGETWGMVGAMIDSGVVAMFGTDRPLIVMKGYSNKTTAPEGILHEVKDDLRLGAMAFNDNGAWTECQNEVNDTIVKYCPPVNRDGARVISPIKDGNFSNALGVSHVEELVTSINDIRATSWTPLAEALFNALGYYGQNTNFRIDANDFKTEGEDANFEDPVQYWCQENNILIITEGASTADINQKVIDSVDTLGLEDPTITVANEGECLNEADQSDLYGSTYLDDLTYFGNHAISANVYTTPSLPSDDGSSMDKQNIRTYMVVSGVPRDDGSASECNPATIMANAATNGGTTLLTGENPSQLEANLRAALSDILFRTSAGSAASVISSSRSGEGGVYQAIFWPKIDRGIGKDPLEWAGDVHAFFIDDHGLLWDDYSSNGTDGHLGELWTEDKNEDGILQPDEDLNSNGVLDGDRRIITYYNESSNSTQICFNPSVIDTGVCEASDYFNTPAGSLELRDFNKYLWSASVQLQSVTDISTNREVLANGTWDYSDNRRYIFTWNDLDNDGIVDSDLDRNGVVDDDGSGNADQEEILPLVAGVNATPLSVAAAVSPRNGFLDDFKVTSNTELDNLIEWLRGNDIYEIDVNNNGILEAAEDINHNGVRDYAFRCRKYRDCENPIAPDNPTWRLADVIHSTPTMAARPAEGYHLAYKDSSYAAFYKKYLDRRHVVYFGSNDGMLHAVNGGFYIPGRNKFLPCSPSQRDPNDKNTCVVGTPYNGNSIHAYPALGDELWAYVPYNLQPHLSCLTDPNYAHKYFVDAPPRLFDVRIFPDDAVHTGGWGTILVGYMRFGGAPTLADETAPFTDNRKFISSYFILDITDPERPPTLLSEMTMTTDTQDYNGDGSAENKYANMGYTTGMPTVVAMRNDLGNSEWYLIIGNGPTTIKGANDQQGKVGIIPLNALTGVNWAVNSNGDYDPTERRPFRIPNTEPTAVLDHFGIKLIEEYSPGLANSFVGDLVSVDFDVKADAIAGIGAPYKSDVVYFGTVDGSDFDATRSYWDGDGRLFRLVTKTYDVLGKEAYSYPESWYLKKLLDAQGPITAAPNVGYDNTNFWVYFGTGRFYAPEDKTDPSMEYFFGVKEPYSSGTCNLNWETLDWWSGAAAKPTNPGSAPGMRGLLRTDQAKVIEWDPTNPNKFLGNYFYCDGCTFPLSQVTTTDVDAAHTYYAFADLEKYIKGEDCSAAADNTIGVDGWYRQFNDLRERSLGMPTLLGGLVTYTSYRPFQDLCRAEGLSYLYGVYYLTGTAWYENVFGNYENAEHKMIVKDRLDLGKGLATTPSLQTGGGPHQVNAYIQTSTGEIVKVGQDNLPLFNFKSGRTNWRNR